MDENKIFKLKIGTKVYFVDTIDDKHEVVERQFHGASKDGWGSIDVYFLEDGKVTLCRKPSLYKIYTIRKECIDDFTEELKKYIEHAKDSVVNAEINVKFHENILQKWEDQNK